MTLDNDGSLLTSLEFFESFGQRYAESLGNRTEEAVEVDGPEIAPSTRAALASLAPDGALVGRTIWGGEGAERTGCFVWTGALAGLIGEDEKPCAELTEEEVETLESHLRLNVEEGGDGPIPVTWETVTRVTGETLEATLQKIGIAEECEIATLRMQTGEQSIEFRFVMATEPAEAASEADATDGPDAVMEEASADSPSGFDVLDEAAELGLGAATGGADEEVALFADEPASEATTYEATGGALPPEDLENLHHLLDVRMPLTIRLGSTRMNLEKLLRLSPGAILELDQREEEPLEVLANGHVIARGEVVVMDERFGLRITEIGAAEERLRASL